MFAKFSCYNTSFESEDRVLNTDHFEVVKPHADVPVDPGAVVTNCCEVIFSSGEIVIVLLSFGDLSSRLNVVVGIVDQTGSIT